MILSDFQSYFKGFRSLQIAGYLDFEAFLDGR